jgi:hypothetical protein
MKNRERPGTKNVRNRAAPGVRDAVDPAASGIVPYARVLSDLRPLCEINERCLELLVSAARTKQPGAFSLVGDLGDLLHNMTPETRARAARRALFLVDMQLTNGEWWWSAKENPSRQAPLPAWQGSFPRAGGIQLARATLSLAWHTAHAAPHRASLLGMTADVADAIRQLPITEIYPVAERRYRHVRPRWEDRPAVWRRLLTSAQSDDIRRARDFGLYSIQLMTADLMSPVGGRRSAS